MSDTDPTEGESTEGASTEGEPEASDLGTVGDDQENTENTLDTEPEGE